MNIKNKRTKEESILADLLRHALWKADLDLSLYEDITPKVWHEVLDMAVRQTVAGNVCDAMMQLPERFAIPREVKMKLLVLLNGIEVHAEKVEKVSAEVALKYREAGLKFFLLKGMASGIAYPVPEHRTQGDIDLYFPDGGCDEAQRILFGEDTGKKSGDARHYHEKYKGVLVENHCEIGHFEFLFYKGLEQELESLLLTKEPVMIGLGAEYMPSPCPDFNAVFMLEHAAFHLPDAGLGLRHLCDWARQLWFYRDSIDAAYVNGVIEKYALGQIANAFALVCINDIGMPEEVCPFPVKRDKRSLSDYRYVYKVIISGGNFGRHFDLLHSTQRHLKLNKWLRKIVSLIVFMRAGRKYRLVNPSLYRRALLSKLRKVFA